MPTTAFRASGTLTRIVTTGHNGAAVEAFAYPGGPFISGSADFEDLGDEEEFSHVAEPYTGGLGDLDGSFGERRNRRTMP